MIAQTPNDRQFRCSALSRASSEPQWSTASTVRSWLLLEQPGPWGSDTPLQSHLPRKVAQALQRVSAQLSIRVVLIRRPGRSAPATRHCFLARTSVRESWLEHTLLSDPADVLDADLARLSRGQQVGLGEREDRPLFLVCTNGRRDPCCAERGRPLARALERNFSDRVWECSHIGGDRFAGNLVCFPHALYFGRVEPSEGPGIAAAYSGGTIDLPHYRGRAAYDFPVQAAEHYLRGLRGIDGVGDLTLAGRRRLDDGTVVARFVGPSGAFHTVRVRPVASTARRLTCHAGEAAPPRSFELVGLD